MIRILRRIKNKEMLIVANNNTLLYIVFAVLTSFLTFSICVNYMFDKPLFRISNWNLLNYEVISPIDFGKLDNKIVTSNTSDTPDTLDPYYHLFKVLENSFKLLVVFRSLKMIDITAYSSEFINSCSEFT